MLSAQFNLAMSGAGSTLHSKERRMARFWPTVSGRSLGAATGRAAGVRYNRLLAALSPVMHCHRAVAERLRRNQLKPSRAGQPALVQGRAVAGDPGVNE